MTELPDVCDFCDIALEEDEELVPVFVGKGGSTAKPVSHRAIIDTRRRRRTDEVAHRIMAKLAEHPNIETDFKPAVEVIESVGGNMHFSDSSSNMPSIGSGPTMGGYQSRYDEDRGGISITVEPDWSEADPDAHLCPSCAGRLETLSE